MTSIISRLTWGLIFIAQVIGRQDTSTLPRMGKSDFAPITFHKSSMGKSNDGSAYHLPRKSKITVKFQWNTIQARQHKRRKFILSISNCSSTFFIQFKKDFVYHQISQNWRNHISLNGQYLKCKLWKYPLKCFFAHDRLKPCKLTAEGLRHGQPTAVHATEELASKLFKWSWVVHRVSRQTPKTS